jgi:hypothetical protein
VVITETIALVAPLATFVDRDAGQRARPQPRARVDPARALEG